jgi:hypothetical protein
MTAENQEPARRRRLRRLEMIFIPPIYFVTAAFGRRIFALEYQPDHRSSALIERRYSSYSGAVDVWSWTIRQPSGVRRKIRVKCPCGLSLTRLVSQRPNTTAASLPKG